MLLFVIGLNCKFIGYDVLTVKIIYFLQNREILFGNNLCRKIKQRFGIRF